MCITETAVLYQVNICSRLINKVVAITDVDCTCSKMEPLNAVCGIACVQRLFGDGPIPESTHIKLQTAGGPDSIFQRIILMKNVYYERSRFHLKRNDKMHFRLRYDEKTNWHRIDFASLGSECLLCRTIKRTKDLCTRSSV